VQNPPQEGNAAGLPQGGQAVPRWRIARQSAITIADRRQQRGEPVLPPDTPVALPAPRPRPLFTRRFVLLGTFWTGLSLSLLALFGPWLDFLYPRNIRGFGGPVPVSKSNIPAPGADPVRNFEGRFWMVNLKPGTTPNGEETEGGVLALWTKCPHLGCTVPWRPDFTFLDRKGWFRCPCHGSTYTKDGGVRVFGPAPRSMDTFKVQPQADGSVVVQTGPNNAKPGGADNPSRAVKLPNA